jgi:hypothetical protein
MGNPTSSANHVFVAGEEGWRPAVWKLHVVSFVTQNRRNTATFVKMKWIPREQPFSRPKPRQVNRHMLLRGLAEEVVYENPAAQRYAELLAAVICDGSPTAKREYEHMLTREWQIAKSLGINRV